MAIGREFGVTTRPGGTWVQTDRAAHEQWARLISSNPKAAALMHVIVGNMGRHNALVVSQEALASLVECSTRTVRRSIEALRDGNWIEVRQIGPSGTVNAYIVNDRVAWSGSRDGIRYSLFSAAVMVSGADQPDRPELDSQMPLKRVPSLFPGERQLPTGPGEPPVSQPSLDGLEPDLPTRQGR